MAPGQSDPGGFQSQLTPDERVLAALAASDPRDELSLRERELEILELYDRAYEQQLEEALLLQDPVDVSSDDANAELDKAERELLEARATYSIRRKAIESVLMAEPSIQSIYSTHPSPTERALLPLIHRRDILSLAYENLASINSSCSERLSNAEVDNIQTATENRDLVQSLLELTRGKDEKLQIEDPDLRSELETLERKTKKAKADYVTMKRIISASIVASGIDWASDETLLKLVVDDESDEI
ncbi:predicted protein [Uncinocarpus reesii 1704]|uniref:Centromere protein H C-terminal domain-containing protein n=1 Tax=Uncinocarpus reesii (strain UAMH 1704) TaxID=336963 RepID=C4JZ24_UNCRE|nr:uncharacterized protein UREG_07425 [Uncinocarpus reesii 1704]EEP82560.1 predicted protein [Uncinocarpus reesii 1704]